MGPAVSALSDRMEPPSAALREDLVRAGLALLAAVDLGLAGFMAFAPHAFYTSIGPFGVANAHYVRDVASFYAAIGLAQAVALRLRGWRVPVLAIAAAQYALYALNHLLDIGRAHPAWTGYFDFASLAATALMTAWLLWLAARAAPSSARAGGRVAVHLAERSPT